MKTVFLILSFVVVLVLIRLLAVKLMEYMRAEAFKKRQKEIQLQRLIERKQTSHNVTNNDSRIVLQGTLNYNEKQNLNSKYIGDVYRQKNGRFASKKKELSNV